MAVAEVDVPDAQDQVMAAAGESTDRELLLRFRTGDEAAFSALVRRHAGLVMGVCQRVLRHRTDAEDAFQATFLVLARKARSPGWQDSITGWLHATARRTSLKLRGLTARRRHVEALAEAVSCDKPSDDPGTQASVRELAGILDEELAGLPARFRDVILLSQVEGLGRDEIAARVGIGVEAVKDRLERGREQLRTRLVRRGVTLSGAVLAAWLVPVAAQAGGVGSLVAVTTQAAGTFASGTLAAGTLPTAVPLAQGVLKMMGFEKLKAVAVGLVSLVTASTIAYGMLQDVPNRFESGLMGQIVAVERAGATPTVTIRLEEFDTLLNLDVAGEVQVWTAFEAGTLVDVRPGQYASLRLADDHRRIREIHLQGAIRDVTIRSLGPDGAVTVVDADDDEDGEGKAIDVKLAPDAILRIGGLPATRAELRPGMQIPLELSPQGTLVNAIEAEAGDATMIEGEVIHIDLATGAVKVRTEDENDQEIEITLKILPDTLIVVDKKAGKLADIRTGSTIVARRTEDKTGTHAIQATSPEPDEDEAVSSDAK